MRTNYGGRRWFHLLFNLTDYKTRGLNEPERSTRAGQGKAEAWTWLTKLLIPRNCYALSSVILWRLINPSHRDDSIQIVKGCFLMLEKSALQSVMTNHNTAIHAWQWSYQSLKTENKSSSEYVRTKKLLQNSSLVLSGVFSAFPNRWTSVKPWLDSWILMLLRLRRAIPGTPFCGSGFFFRK